MAWIASCTGYDCVISAIQCTGKKKSENEEECDAGEHKEDGEKTGIKSPKTFAIMIIW